MFGFLKKKKIVNPYPRPPWIKWLVIAFIAYAALSNVHSGKHETPAQTAFKKAEENLNPKKLVNLDDYKNKLFPDRNSSLKIKDTESGSGEPLVCGQEVTLAYDAYLENSKPINDRADKNKPLVFRIGQGRVIPALEQGVVGMRLHGKRSIIAPAPMAYGLPEFARDDVSKNATIRFETEVLGASPKLPDLASNPYRISNIQLGGANVLTCGKEAKVNIIIWDVAGKKLYSSKDEHQPVTFIPGKSEVFLGLDQGVIDMGEGGIRMLVVPPAFQKTMNGNTPAINFPFPAHQTVLVEVESLP